MDFPFSVAVFSQIILRNYLKFALMDSQHVAQDENVKFPDPATDYHGHPNYLKILILLFAFFAASLLIGNFTLTSITVAVIFATAFYKAVLVIKNFMHLRYEPIIIWIGVLAAVFCLIAFFFGIYPDITATHLDVVPR
ncbi:hypothetical protein MASR2M18_14820 [Ignavibacteria bacterium]